MLSWWWSSPLTLTVVPLFFWNSGFTLIFIFKSPSDDLFSLFPSFTSYESFLEVSLSYYVVWFEDSSFLVSFILVSLWFLRNSISFGLNFSGILHLSSSLIGISPICYSWVLLIALSSFSNSTFLSYLFWSASFLSFIASSISSFLSFSCLAYLCNLLSPTIYISLSASLYIFWFFAVISSLAVRGFTSFTSAGGASYFCAWLWAGCLAFLLSFGKTNLWFGVFPKIISLEFPLSFF